MVFLNKTLLYSYEFNHKFQGPTLQFMGLASKYCISPRNTMSLKSNIFMKRTRINHHRKDQKFWTLCHELMTHEHLSRTREGAKEGGGTMGVCQANHRIESNLHFPNISSSPRHAYLVLATNLPVLRPIPLINALPFKHSFFPNFTHLRTSSPCPSWSTDPRPIPYSLPLLLPSTGEVERRACLDVHGEVRSSDPP
jgi:hypothetical protein